MSEAYYSQQEEYAVVHARQDVRNWPIFGADGLPLGHIKDMIFSTENERVDFLEIDNGSKVRIEDVEILADRVRIIPNRSVI